MLKYSCFLIRSSPFLKLQNQKLVFKGRQRKKLIQGSQEVSNKDGEEIIVWYSHGFLSMSQQCWLIQFHFGVPLAQPAEMSCSKGCPNSAAVDKSAQKLCTINLMELMEGERQNWSICADSGSSALQALTSWPSGNTARKSLLAEFPFLSSALK